MIAFLKDKDGFITLEEFRAYHSKANKDDSAISKAFAAIDSDKDGLVTFEGKKEKKRFLFSSRQSSFFSRIPTCIQRLTHRSTRTLDKHFFFSSFLFVNACYRIQCQFFSLVFVSHYLLSAVTMCSYFSSIYRYSVLVWCSLNIVE